MNDTSMDQAKTKTQKMTMAQALVKFLNQQYIRVNGKEYPFIQGVFTIFGHGNVVGLGQALEQQPGHLRVYQGCNEQGMAHIATGFAKQKKRQQIFAVTSSVGPGAANMVTAGATATANRIPLLLLPGDTFACRQPDPVLQQVEQYGDGTVSTNDCFRPVSRYWDRISRPEQLMTAMIHAMRVLTDPADTGAVTICLPQDVQGEVWNYPDYFFQKRVHQIERRPASQARIQTALALIQRKKKPLLICGGGVRYSEAHEAFRQFAEIFNIPFAETQAGKSAIVAAHPLNCGGIGTTGCSSANLLAKEADLIIGIGTRFSDFTTASKSLFQHPEVEFLTINVAEFDAVKLDAVAVLADAREGLNAIAHELAKTVWCSQWQQEIAHAKAAWQQELERLFSIQYQAGFKPEIAGHLEGKLGEYSETLQTHLTQTRVLGLMGKYLEPNAIIVGASGSLPGDLQRVWQPKVPDTYHLEYGYSCMGYEIAASVGAKLACPDQPVYAMVGDGSYLMLNSELQTAIQENIKITVLLFDNAGFGCINNLQMSQGMGSFATENRYRNPQSGQLDGALIKVDFAKNAESYGCKSYRVHDEQQLIAALLDAQRQPRATLIDIKVLPKTMTHDYESWWRTGTAQVADNPAITESAEKIRDYVEKKVRQY
ncbi:putative malonic semialdehyde oxidative decarboxylase [Xenorhabdus nematophila ATCC 19061]|uniref:Malonic semialdehyde oxidative decarboxylase n=1 Tax=Xenorhabdus nematophila (strain ATCC 19061 / DSM 3370 / CCUG 14189 / LMG 1036 / NCIMB 9965 / AN6) TaxID=406817 RepID=D3VJX9_XENNA|nr:3D-(3,5/4)-trihydroxycyclohexane-1,2-dione acylhydrolase (decyclizing) [Xenorhabdus nematophila]CBJ91038.1 putative malonic semialdehyde oxidative decarboxylase [Xenorhabdus nematophila ATCC 19061]CEE90393.1 putative malonic semialdehyde oxidative decarboxylase [Xenorhabdus nematophila str. Anatoliense]CEE92352.1 putative malonic semialdehyde oxidative decarboxylase [Xenorhabdus nematophila str. Anatoliense]CEK23858.1 putative malonic semialdehyde oxidative decarboxylase [Xenorhabdus nematop